MGLVLMVLSIGAPQIGKATVMMETCKDLAFSTSEDFVTRGPVPPDGNSIISEGDLLGGNCTICARNADLLAEFDVNPNHDLGLDAVDVIDVEGFLVAFSTELDSSNSGQFMAGDLLVTKGSILSSVIIIPNQALTFAFGQGAIQVDLGLDAVHFIGSQESVIGFLEAAARYTRDQWLNPEPGLLVSLLSQFEIDIWFSTEGTPGPVGRPLFLDGDVLSVVSGTVVAGNNHVLPSTVPGGIPDRGVDFGLDALTSVRTGEIIFIHFSTELLYANATTFSDGDVLLYDNGLVYTNPDLVGCFEPRANMLGLDALYLGNIQTNSIYLPLLQDSQGAE
jgi:hypothetical protein